MRQGQATLVFDQHAFSVGAAVRQGPDEPFHSGMFHVLTVELPDSSDPAHGSFL